MSGNQTVHLIGIGGIGMSGLARMYLARGWRVQGTDLKKNDVLRDLERAGANVLIGHDAAHVNGATLVVYSSSIPETHAERQEAVRKGVRVIHRAQALAAVCADQDTIAVTGTHGKTTTTALIGTVFREAGRDPSIVVGGVVTRLGGNALRGAGREIIIEADESDSSFLQFSPKLEVITNIEEEHMEHFGSVERVEEAYRSFIRRLSADGEWFGCAEDARVRRLAAEEIRPATLYGFDAESASLVATDIVECPEGRRGVSFRVWKDGACLGPVTMRIVGRHNVLNALAAVGVALKRGIAFPAVADALGKFEGVRRRFDVKFESAEFLLVDDYGHHPTEIRRTLEAARALGKKRIVAVFQPHRYTRTQSLFSEFATCFEAADALFVTDIYAASEAPIAGVSGERLAEAVRARGRKDVRYATRGELFEAVRGSAREGDLVITLGAGDIHEVAAQLAHVLRAARLKAAVRGRVAEEELLAKHTTLKVGGPAEFWIEPEDIEDLKRAFAACREMGVAVQVFGAGSNVLAPDEGLRGAVIHLGAPAFRTLRADGVTLVAGAGVQNTLFIQYALDQGFGGVEFLLGIPGTIGGAVAMNAGSHGESVDRVLESVRVVTLDGREKVLRRAEVPFRYRSAGLAHVILVEAAFRLPRCERAEVQKKLDAYRDHRVRTQDLKHPSAGCMFKNPEGGACSSGKLIEDAGLKGRRIGNAQISPIHANFIINLGGASSGDILKLMEEARETVKRKFNVDLESEVRIL
jgi:UDP-N-acetylmuramate--L-alanine ligase/UDP-N-acetylenolpyruvoylglucosamine reductase